MRFRHTLLLWLLLPANAIAAAPGAAPDSIVLVGDSTVAPGGGWGPGFCANLRAGVRCLDLGVNGRSSKSYREEGLWQKALDAHGNLYLIQFGHNDQKDDPARHTDPTTSYADNLRRFAGEVRAQGATPVLVTPLSRRNYKGDQLAIDPLREYAAAARQVAQEMHLPLVDLYARSTALLGGMTQAEADTLDAAAHPDARAENSSAAKPDRTHLNDKGKLLFGRMVAEALGAADPEFAPELSPEPATHLPPSEAR